MINRWKYIWLHSFHSRFAKSLLSMKTAYCIKINSNWRLWWKLNCCYTIESAVHLALQMIRSPMIPDQSEEIISLIGQCFKIHICSIKWTIIRVSNQKKLFYIIIFLCFIIRAEVSKGVPLNIRNAYMYQFILV